MKAFATVSAPAIPFGRSNIDTDVIIPADYLKAVTRKGMGKGAFKALRFNEDGSLNMESVFNQPRYTSAQILIAGANFGCGSSREHAAWALDDMGIRVVLAPSFSDIFASNAFKNGVLTVSLPQEEIDTLMEVAETQDITVDLEDQVVTTPGQHRFTFEVDPFRKHCLLNGLDEIGLTLTSVNAISAHEAALAVRQPWLFGKSASHSSA